jgi:hypothetical protein
MDIPQHKALERGQQLNKVHISHPQTPSIVHVSNGFHPKKKKNIKICLAYVT